VGPRASSANPVAKLIFHYRPEGWNTWFREETQQWEEVRHVETGEPLYQSADFSPLSAMKLPDPVPWTGPRDVAGPRRAGLHVETVLESHQRHGQPKTLLVAVRNHGTVPIPDLSVHWVHENETAQPWDVGAIKALGIGGSVSLMREDSFDGTLQPGKAVPFLLDERFLDGLVSQVAALSRERYWLSVRSCEKEICRVDGSQIGVHLEELASA
jgi:hypothetical protein